MPDTPNYAVMLHVTGIPLDDEKGGTGIGGAYTWRCVQACDEQSAAELAIQALLNDGALLAEVPEWDRSAAQICVEEMALLKEGSKKPSTGFVFYLETED